MHIRGIILEGNSNAGKTSMLRAIKQLQAQNVDDERSVVILGEQYSQILNNVHGKYINLNRYEHLRLLSERVAMLKNLNEWAVSRGPASRRSRGLFYILERFHLNHRVAFHDYDTSKIIEIENELVSFGAKCILLTISQSVIEERIKSRRPNDWTTKSKEEVYKACQIFESSQNDYRKQYIHQMYQHWKSIQIQKIGMKLQKIFG
jgi:thymidylate kinase